MLAVRIIPVILFRGTQAVKGERFQSWRSIGHVMQQVRIYQERGVDELILLDIAATPEGRGPNFGLIEELSRELFCPLTVGGGVRSVEDVRDLLNAGADKVSVSTNAKQVLPDASSRFGRQALVACVDYIGSGLTARLRNNLSRSAYDHADDCDDWGAGEIVLHSVDRDGAMTGYDLELVAHVQYVCACPLIVLGGCSGLDDMVAAIKAGADAVAAGALFAFTDATPRDAAQYLHQHGIEARI